MSVPVDWITRAVVGTTRVPGGATRVPVGTSRVPHAIPTPAQNWLAQYAKRVAWTDLTVIAATVIAGQLLLLGSDLVRPVGDGGIPAIVVSLALILCWQFAFRVGKVHDPRILGSGLIEYHRVLSACFWFFGACAGVDILFNLGIVRDFVALILPAGALLVLGGRTAWRRYLTTGRRQGRFLRSVLVVGTLSSARALIERLNQHPDLGYRVVGICLTDPPATPAVALTSNVDDGTPTAEVPLFIGHDAAPDLARACGATTVAVTSADALGSRAMRELAWELENCDVEMLVAPGLVGVSGRRITIRPEAGLPLLHIDKPQYRGANKVLKMAFDKALAAVGLVILSPVLLACAIAVKLDSPGPVFYRAERVGTDNRPFTMWKFRSMVTEADALRADIDHLDQGNGVLFKVRTDPRVTRVGRIIRRYSLDELPQLFNVLNGTMSLVGPRPPIREEVDAYDRLVERRMLVRPGMTGLWQISGRSDLSWEESVHLDLAYVENWSMTADLVILWRTVRAVLSHRGAY